MFKKFAHRAPLVRFGGSAANISSSIIPRWFWCNVGLQTQSSKSFSLNTRRCVSDSVIESRYMVALQREIVGSTSGDNFPHLTKNCGIRRTELGPRLDCTKGISMIDNTTSGLMPSPYAQVNQNGDHFQEVDARFPVGEVGRLLRLKPTAIEILQIPWLWAHPCRHLWCRRIPFFVQ